MRHFANVNFSLTKICWRTGLFCSVSFDFFEVARDQNLGSGSGADLPDKKKIPPASTMIWLKLCGIQLRFRLYSSSVCESMIVFLEQMMRDLGGRSKILGRDWPFQNKEKKLIEILLTNNYLPKTIETLCFVLFWLIAWLSLNFILSTSWVALYSVVCLWVSEMSGIGVTRPNLHFFQYIQA